MRPLEDVHGSPVPPCRDCGARCVGCHGRDENGRHRCDAFGAYEAEKDQFNAGKRAVIRQQEAEFYTREQAAERRARQMREKKRGKR